ncbi:MAG: DeoR family transcriptional regulator [bacterium]
MEAKTSYKILEYIKQKGQASGNELTNHFDITSRAIRKQLSSLLNEGKIYKIGRPPKVFYLLAEDKIKKEDNTVDEKTRKIIDENFLNITPSGERQEGFEGFINWCLKRKDPLEKTAKEYVDTLKKYKRYKKDGLINGMHKLKGTFPDTAVDKLFYLDFYSIERFGKTKLGQLLLYAKQSQNRGLIKELVDQIRPQIEELIMKYKIEAVGFIPPTVKREIQLMRELERQLHLTNPKVSLVKVKTPVIVPQKTLNKLEDRIENAKGTIMVDDTKKFKTVLLIDDALGSGATINETAKKIKNQGLADTIIGLAITGSFSGFEVISEV